MDHILPFLLNESPVRGRAVRLSDSVSLILGRHHYPPRISALLGEALAIVSILSSSLKQDGIFTLQIQSKGPLSLLVADATAGGNVRGYAQYDAADCPANAMLSELCADGYLAITLDSGAENQRYQGVVALEGETIAEIIEGYFSQSQQLPVHCRLAVGQVTQNGQTAWVAGGIYMEYVPESAESGVDSEAWHEAAVLFNTVRDDELLDCELPLPDLLHRLFHEGGIWIYDAKPVQEYCRCNREKIRNTIANMGQEAIAEMVEDGAVTVNCQFCNQSEHFSPQELMVASSRDNS